MANTPLDLVLLRYSRTVNNRKAVKDASIRLLLEGYSFCEGSALNLPQGTTSLDPLFTDTVRNRKQPQGG